MTEFPAAFPQSTEQPSACPAFAHAAEEEFARLLDFYGVRWEYEPRTFVLRADHDGNPVAAFTPDFYLPDEDLFVEITTMRPKQVRRKNRKIRWLAEQYPEVNIKLYKRSDFRQLLAKYGLDDLARVPWIGADGVGNEGEDEEERKTREMKEMSEGTETGASAGEGSG